MSGTEIFGVAAAALQFAQFIGSAAIFINTYKNAGAEYTSRLAELHSKLRTFQSTLESLHDAAQTIEESNCRTPKESSALNRMKRGLDESYQTLDALFGCWGKFRKRGARSGLRAVVDYWFYNNEGQAVVARGVGEIVDRVSSIKTTLLSIQTHVIYDTRDNIHALHDRRTSATPSAVPAPPYGNCYDTTISYDGYEVKWDLELLVDSHPTSGTSDLSDALISAIENKKSGVMAVLLENGEDPLAKDENGWCALHYAVRADSKTIMRKLLRSRQLKDGRERVDKRNRNGATPLHFASSIGMKSMAKELLKAGADKDAVDNHNRSPLFVAVERNQTGMVELLLDEGAQFARDEKSRLAPSIPPRFKTMQNAIIYRKGIAAKTNNI